MAGKMVMRLEAIDPRPDFIAIYLHIHLPGDAFDPTPVNDDEFRRLNEAMQKLRPYEKLVLDHYALEIPRSETARMLGMSVEEVYRVKYRSLKKLRELMNKDPGDDSQASQA